MDREADRQENEFSPEKTLDFSNNLTDLVKNSNFRP